MNSTFRTPTEKRIKVRVYPSPSPVTIKIPGVSDWSHSS